MADSYQKKEREKKKRKRKKEKQERKEQRKLEGKTQEEFMYVDENGHLTATPPDPAKRKVKLEDIEIGVPKKDTSSQSQFEKQGKVKFFNSEKGYGFITDKETGESYFIHANELEIDIEAEDEVTFEIGSGPKGPVAQKVQRA